ncbi:GNAT family N-acetyltransferase [Sphingomonas sanxanigenens]|uniref:GNAT family N-acetyltransferase n=1 Tax=Sphingomonas sanxanigenens TaxID=397260 RepID=UPI001FDEDFE9|nr:GNAT family N-acetyltransferase [Sphingomonas sanxanigenens]
MLPWRAGRKVAEVGDDQLREMAEHRGLKLVKSRRRKPGTGDFGKYGLTDAGGKALLGIGDDGLTASAQDIQDYLRTSEQSTWKQSADTTPDRPASPEKPRSPVPDGEDGPVRRRSKRAPVDRSAPGAREDSAPELQKSAAKARPKPSLKLVPKAEAEPKPKPEPKAEPAPAPVLRVRAATSADSDALSALLSQLNGVSLDSAEVADNLAAARKAKAGMVVADLDGIVGCCGWAVVATVHRGAIGRLTALVVDKGHRRRGIGTEMLAAAETALAKAGCRQVEAMSDITINNSHNFFRSLKFEQTSYRFVRGIEEQSSGERVRTRTD